MKAQVKCGNENIPEREGTIISVCKMINRHTVEPFLFPLIFDIRYSLKIVMKSILAVPRYVPNFVVYNKAA